MVGVCLLTPLLRTAFSLGDTLMGSFRKKGVVHPRTRTRAFDQVVGTRLRAYRNELGLSQTKFADGLHISAQQLQKYETGVNSLSLGRAVEVSDLLGVSLNKLAGVNGVAVGLTAIERLDFQIQNEIRKFNDASKPRVLNTLKHLQRYGPS
jgi:transcriptional regulator with XRE-family HTH domain